MSRRYTVVLALALLVLVAAPGAVLAGAPGKAEVKLRDRVFDVLAEYATWCKSQGAGEEAARVALEAQGLAADDAKKTQLTESLESAGMSIDDLHVDYQADSSGFDKRESADRDWDEQLASSPRSNAVAASQHQLPANTSPKNGMVDILV